MPTLGQEVDSIINSEGITDATPSQEVEIAPAVEPEIVETPETPTEEVTLEKPTEPVVEPTPEEPKEPEVVTPAEPTPSATETVQEAKTLMQNLNLSEEAIFNDKGEVKPFTEVVPVGAYLASQLTPVKVTDKDGKEYEFMLIADVEKLFPNGFEAKNNLEQMRFQQAILANETTFNSAVKTYNEAQAQYTKETSDIVQSRGDNERLGKEYRAMAEAGLVPKVEGDPSDPKFLESTAVKEMNKILNYMETKNKELASKGLGQVNSLYVAKQLMDAEVSTVKKEDTKTAIINERKEVASLSSIPTNATTPNKPQQRASVPMSRLADDIIASEGLK
jgi:hypothetical protein